MKRDFYSASILISFTRNTKPSKTFKKSLSKTSPFKMQVPTIKSTVSARAQRLVPARVPAKVATKPATKAAKASLHAHLTTREINLVKVVRGATNSI